MERTENRVKDIYLSIIIPTYNEEKRISATLSRIQFFLRSKTYDYEIIVVDDGSSDNTVSIIEKDFLTEDGKIRIVKNGSNKGKGFSVKNGILGSSGKYVLFSDADLSAPIEEVDRLLKYINKDYDICIGSRSLKGSNVEIHQPWYREGMGKVFNFMVKLLLFKDFNDTQCGFKLFKGDIARKLADLMKIDGFCFDVEIIYLAKRMGYRIVEVGVSWKNSPESRVKLINSSLDMFRDLFKIKQIHEDI